MSAADIRIAAARGEVAARRADLWATIDEIKARLAPKAVAHNAWEGAKDKTGEVAESTLAAVKERPLLTAGVVAGAGALIARKPLFAFVARLFEDREESAPVFARKRVPAPKPKTPRKTTPTVKRIRSK
ncbi:DUF3618 domain-containing protein [Sphingomonas sp.]|uniref:DUF3618 domain-containing protein n=1 Tax=Sphingomonas sp. TaxID=28214 RepID=UPI00286ADA6E|nr:DUF3618 domain-containing protein [Sphingomonas sp.]